MADRSACPRLRHERALAGVRAGTSGADASTACRLIAAARVPVAMPGRTGSAT